MENKVEHIPYNFVKISSNKSLQNSIDFYHTMNKRRSCRYFSDTDIDPKIIEYLILTAGTAPSGAHKQPWTFVVIDNKNKILRKKIRDAAEKEEKLSYESRMTQEWLDALAPLGTNWEKPFLENAPYLIVVLRQRHGINEDGSKIKHYYTSESVGIAVGILISAIHNAGLVTLTHTPSPMNFLKKILNRPDNEIPYVLLPVGYPTEDATVPNLTRKSLKEIMVKF